MTREGTLAAVAEGLLDVNGARLWYESAGSGSAVVLLHGHLLDSGQWDGQFGELARSFFVVRYDARGFGRSDLPAGPFGYHSDLLGVLDALGIERAALVGCSGGGMTAIDLALERPERVAALVLVGSGLSGYRFPGEMPAEIAAARAARAAGEIDRAVELGLHLWTDGPRRRPDQVDAAARERTREMMTRLWSRPPAPAADVRVADPPAASRLGEIRAPALVLIGGEDFPPGREMADVLAREVPGARRLDIPDAGHHPNMEHPALFNEAVLAFLRSAVSD
jgi:3-oxoadipate enol-lactonase